MMHDVMQSPRSQGLESQLRTCLLIWGSVASNQLLLRGSVASHRLRRGVCDLIWY